MIIHKTTVKLFFLLASATHTDTHTHTTMITKLARPVEQIIQPLNHNPLTGHTHLIFPLFLSLIWCTFHILMS